MLNYGCEGLTAVISGGTSGIGLACAEKLLRDGARVYLLGRSAEKGLQAEDGLQRLTGRRPVYIGCNVAEEESCRQAAGLLRENLAACGAGERIHILINSAGVYEEKRLENITAEDFERIMGTNVRGTMLLTKACLPMMYAGAGIVNIASDAGLGGNYGCPLYCASKGAVVALTRALALDLAPAIRVNCVCPADVDTPLLQKQLKDCGGSYTMADMAGSYPLGRIGRAEEIAHAVCSVASPAASFMTGSIIAADGGLTAG